MHLQRRIQQTQTVLAVGGTLLVLCYLGMYRPLVKTSESLDEPLMQAWQRLVATNVQDQTVEGLAMEEIRATLQAARLSRVRFDAVRGTVLARLALETNVARKLGEPFQLIDFQNERQNRVADLIASAKKRGVKLGTNVFSQFPDYSVDQGPSALLWAKMAFAESILATAIHCGASTIHRVQWVPPRTTNFVESAGLTFDELAFRAELTGPTPAISKFLASMPLRAAAIESLGLPVTDPAKPALFIDSLMLRKTSPEKHDEVLLKATVIGFVPANHRIAGALPAGVYAN